MNTMLVGIISITSFLIGYILGRMVYGLKLNKSNVLDDIDVSNATNIIISDNYMEFISHGKIYTFHGSSTVWRYPNYERCSTELESKLADIWHKGRSEHGS